MRMRPHRRNLTLNHGVLADVHRLTSLGRITLPATVVGIAMLVLAAPAWSSPPDNRVYEMVSPVEKGGESHMPNLAVASADGEHVVVDGGVANALLSSGASWMVENRTPTGWSGTQVGPPPSPGGENNVEQRSTALAAVSEDGSRFAFQTLVGVDTRDKNSPEDVVGVPWVEFLGPVRDVPSSDVYVDGQTGSFTFASGPPAPTVKTTELPPKCSTESVYCGTNNAVFGGASSNLSVVVWSQLSPIVAPPASLPGSPPDTHQHGSEVYESTNGTNQSLVGLVPASGTECGPAGGSCIVPPCGAAMGDAPGRWSVLQNSFAPTAGAVSGDGSQVVFTSPEPSTEEEGCPPGELFIRQDGTTVQVSASHKTGGDPHGPRPKVYAGAAQEGGQINTVFFTSSEALTNNANTGSEDEGRDLYAFSVKTGTLTDITPDTNAGDANGADVVSFIGSSANGRIVYFTAAGALTAEPNGRGQTAQSGGTNLYVYDASTGTTRFIAPGSGLRGPVAARELGYGVPLTVALTPDGRHLVFASTERLTAYDNVGAICGFEWSGRYPAPCNEIYLYDEADNSTVCASCNPSGAPPTEGASLPKEFEEGFFDFFERVGTLRAPIVVTDNGGRVFFDSPDQLTPEAPTPTDAKFGGVNIAGSSGFEPNVYEYEEGHVHLIVPDAALATTTPSGNDVFFYTAAQLVPQDKDGTLDIYDARVGGGFPAIATPECSGTACQGQPAPAPIFEVPPSRTFAGVGNYSPTEASPSPAKGTAKVHHRGKHKHRRKKRIKKSGRRARRGRRS